MIVPHILDAIGEMRLAVTFPYITDDPSKAMIAVMDECLQMLTLACRLPMDACLNVAISINFGQAVSVKSMKFRPTTLYEAHALEQFESRKIEDRKISGAKGV